MALDYVKAACVAILLSNDFKHIHFHANGEDFDKIHNLAEDYYNHLNDEADYLCELTMENHQSMVNPTMAMDKVAGWSPETGEEYEYSSCLQAISIKLNLYMEELHVLRTETPYEDVKSKLDDMIRWWRKELDYKMNKRSQVVTSSFRNAGSDDRTAQFIQEQIERNRRI
jgi:DNA-binding ferritin-like protein